MHGQRFCRLLAVMTAVVAAWGVCFAAEEAPDMGPIRNPAVSGRFYPDDPQKLSTAVSAYLNRARKPLGPRPLAIIAPHAGYIFSGQICADAFNQAKGHDYDLVVVLGTNHTSGRFRQVSVYPRGGFQTPLGTVRIDSTLSGRLLSKSPEVVVEESVHREEHSIEVMLPFAQALFPGVKMVAAIVGSPDLGLCERFGKLLAEVIREENRRALIVASSDFSHYPSYNDAVSTDRAVLAAILSMDLKRVQEVAETHMEKGIPNLTTCACGQGPILAAMVAAGQLGAKCPRLISYANSGDAAVGDRNRVVGYGAVAFFPETPCPSEMPEGNTDDTPAQKDEVLDPHRQAVLLQLARDAIRQYLDSETAPLPRSADSVLQLPRGAFVTLKRNGTLRGCIGYMAEDSPLCRTVSAMALQAAFNDRRFAPVSIEELSELKIEVSVLTPFKRVEGPEAIRVGIDGVVLEQNGKRAVFLPQVAVERHWDRETLLDNLCGKAGLPPGSWKRGAEFYTFQAQVFAEPDIPKSE